MQLTATDVTKVIKGKTVLSHINLSLNSGYVYGFVGPNASGKTMLFRVLSGLISATTGIVSLNGKILKKAFPVLPDLGILLENVSLYPELTGYENLDYLAKFNHKIDKAGIIEALQRVGLDPADKRKYGKYHRLTRANTPDSVSFRRFLLFSPWRAPASLQRNVARQHRREYADSASLRLKNQKSLENTSLAGAEQFCRSRNVSRQEKTRREYLPYCQGA